MVILEERDRTDEVEDGVAENSLGDVAIVSREGVGIACFLEADGETAVVTSSLVPWVASREACNIYQTLDDQSDQGEECEKSDGVLSWVRVNFSVGRDPYNVLDHYRELLHLLHVALDLLNVALDLLNVALDLLNVALDLLNVALDLLNVALDLLNVALDLLHVALDLLNVALDLLNVALDLLNVALDLLHVALDFY